MQISILAILVATVLVMLLGYVWYSPKFFGKKWQKAMGFKEDASLIEKDEMIKTLFLDFIFTLILVISFNLLFLYSNLSVWYIALIVGVGFITPIVFSNSIWDHKSMVATLIGIGYRLASLVVVALVFISPLVIK